jgi:voltage-gated sodium channel
MMHDNGEKGKKLFQDGKGEAAEDADTEEDAMKADSPLERQATEEGFEQLLRQHSAGGSSVNFCCASIVYNKNFDIVLGAFILTNAVLIGLEADYQARHIGQPPPKIFEVLEDVYCVIFAAELGLRLWVYGREFWCSKDWQWNYFDFTVVVLQVFDVCSRPFVSSMNQVDFSFLRAVRLVRLLRIARLARLLHLIVELRTMISSIGGSVRALGWALLILLLLIYALGVFFTQFVTEQRELQAGDSEQLQRYFGNVPITLISLWACISGGMDWMDMFGPLREAVSPLVCLVFLAYIAFCVLSILNIVTGICVDQARKDALKDQDIYLAKNVANVFKQALNLNGHGQMTWVDFHAKLKTPELQEFFKSVNVDEADAKKVFDLIDVDGDGAVGPNELMSGWLRLRGPARSLDLVSFMDAQETYHAELMERLDHLLLQ